MMQTVIETYNNKFKWLSIPKNAVLILILVNLAITIPLAVKMGIWVDEAYTLQTTSENVGYALERALKFELQAPLYFILLNLWRNFNDSIFFARLFSIICIAMFIFVSGRVSSRYFPDIHPVYFAGLVAFNPFTIWAALEIRRYALILLLSALLFLFLYDAYVREKSDKRAKIYYSITAIIGLYTQYYIGLLLLAHAFAILASGNLRRLYSFILHMLIVGLAFSPMLPVVMDQISGQSTMRTPFIDLFRIFKVVLTNIEYFLIPMRDLPLDRSGRWVIRILAIILIIIAFNRMKHKPIIKLLNPTVRIALSSVFVLFAQFLIILVFVREGLLGPRHISFFFLPALILIFSVLNLSGDIKFLKKWVLIFLCFYSIMLFQIYKATAKVGDFKRVASFIMNNEKPGEAILIFPQDNALPLKFHYSGLNVLVPIPSRDRPNSLDVEKYDLSNNVIDNESEIVESLSAIPKNPEVMWVVKYPICGYLGVNYNCEIFDQFVEKNYNIKSSRSFFKDTKVMLIEKKHKPPRT